MYRQLCTLSIGLLLCGPVLAASEKCTYKVTSCVNKPGYGHIYATIFNGSDDAYVAEYMAREVSRKGDHAVVGCGESQCDTMITVERIVRSRELWHHDACEDIWISGSTEELRQIKIVTTPACDNK